MSLFNRVLGWERKGGPIHLVAAIGSTGAVTLDASQSYGVASIARTDTGDYTVTLRRPVKCMFGYHVGFVKSDAASTIFKVEAATRPSNSKTITLVCQNASEASTDPASGSTMVGTFWVRYADID